MTVGQALRDAARRVGAFDARVLLEEACGVGAAAALAHPERTLDDEAQAGFAAMLARRERGEPVAYITGHVGFYGRTFAVDPRVLVPRPETEHIVEAVLDDVRARRAAGAGTLRVADVGTGSGAIAITMAAELDGVEVVASDVSDAALEVARANAVRLGVADQVRFVAGDLLEPLAAVGPYACIVANLPYIPSGDVPALPDPVAFEPRTALDGGRDGLALYRRLLVQAGTALVPGGVLFMEAAPGTVEPLGALAARTFGAGAVEIGTDYAGLERYVAVTAGSEFLQKA